VTRNSPNYAVIFLLPANTVVLTIYSLFILSKFNFNLTNNIEDSSGTCVLVLSVTATINIWSVELSISESIRNRGQPASVLPRLGVWLSEVGKK